MIQPPGYQTCLGFPDAVRSCKIMSSLSTHCLLFYELCMGCCLPVAPALGSAFRFISFRFVASTYVSMDREAWQAAVHDCKELDTTEHACTYVSIYNVREINAGMFRDRKTLYW